jgi:hypothetical protein
LSTQNLINNNAGACLIQAINPSSSRRMPTEVSLESVTLADQVSGSKRVTVKESDEAYINRPNIDGAKFLINGEIRDWTGEVQTVESPVYLEGSDTMVTVYYH